MLGIRTQIIDDFVGNLTVLLSFSGENIDIQMVKSARFFLVEYRGCASGSSRMQEEIVSKSGKTLDKQKIFVYNTSACVCGHILASGETGGLTSKRRCKQHG